MITGKQIGLEVVKIIGSNIATLALITLTVNLALMYIR